MTKRKKSRITITFAHEKQCFCSHCNTEIPKGTPYFTFNLINTTWGHIEKKISLCKSCVDTAIEDYKGKEGNYGEWLKRRIAKNL